MKRYSLFYSWRIFFFELILFCLALGLGILGGLKMEKIFKVYKISPTKISVGEFLIYFILVTGILLFLIYFFKHKKSKTVFLKGIFLLTITFGNFYFFNLWLPSLYTIILVAFIVFLLLKTSWLSVHNLAMVFAIAGVGAGLGLSFQPEMVILLLLILSVYDFIAVYKTKHMIKMAKEMLSHQAILGIIVPQKISDFQTNLKEVKPGGKFLILGAGDIIFPLILAVSLIPQGIFHSLIVALFSLIGLLAGFLIFISQKKRRAIPALPPIAFFSIIGYLVTRII